jgi:hypothetical protein
MEEAEIKYVRKRLYVTEKAPALSVDSDGYVRCGIKGDMSDSDMLVLGLVLSLKNKEWKVLKPLRLRSPARLSCSKVIEF